MQRLSTTPFGRRPVTAGLLATQALAAGEAPCPPADKWDVFRDLCAARTEFGVTDRDLTVLNALLSFYPETDLTGEKSIVFPSNQSLSERAHGMAESTLRRHLAALVSAGLILRHDSPNGKRYCSRDRSGTIVRAFGFDLRPLLVRAHEIQEAARKSREAALALRRAREDASLLLRDATKLAEYGHACLQGNWEAVLQSLSATRKVLRRKLDLGSVRRVRDELDQILRDILRKIESEEMSGSAIGFERHHQTSDTKNPDTKNSLEDRNQIASDIESETPRLPLGLVREACPEMTAYAACDIGSWRALVDTARTIGPMMGIAPSALEEAESVMGPPTAAITLACILQRMDRIRSPGGYLRSLSRKAKEGAFSPGPMVMALLREAA